MSLGIPDYKQPIDSPSWRSWFNSLILRVAILDQSGTTANRPTSNLWVGRFYFDTTLNKPIWVKTASSTPVWVDATGTTV